VTSSFGFSIILPPKWYAVPRTVTAVNQTIAALKKQKKTGLATAYGFYTTANGKAELKAYVFQAFLFDGPTSDPVPEKPSRMTFADPNSA